MILTIPNLIPNNLRSSECNCPEDYSVELKEGRNGTSRL